ncbi:hypothetical protein BGZ92_006051 [Podila epicladia]|nr:hypothetical protein BGZ92_006051 [Podila epicladia]
MTYIRECLDTGEEFDLSRLLDKTNSTSESPMQLSTSNTEVTTSNKNKNKKKVSKRASHKDAVDSDSPGTDHDGEDDKHLSAGLAGTALSPRGSSADLKPQIARPVSILNGIPPKAATFGLGENRGIHSMAEVLLRFLESLKEPVVPTEMYYRALEVANHQQAAYGLLDLMPPVNVNVFVYITSFLRELILTGGSGSGNTHSGGSAQGTAAPDSGRAGSIYNGNDATSITGRKRDDEEHRTAKLAAVFSSVMLRPPPGAERLSEVEALKRKSFLMQFLQEPAEEEGLGGGGGLGSGNTTQGGQHGTGGGSVSGASYTSSASLLPKSENE